MVRGRQGCQFLKTVGGGRRSGIKNGEQEPVTMRGVDRGGETSGSGLRAVTRGGCRASIYMKLWGGEPTITLGGGSEMSIGGRGPPNLYIPKLASMVRGKCRSWEP